MIADNRGSSGLVPRIVVLGATMALALVGTQGVARGTAGEDEVNACGCHRDSADACYCEHKSRCGCPGECEPKGSEEKRAKQLEKEVELETKKAEAAARQKQPAATTTSGRASAHSVEPQGTKPHKRSEHRMTPAEKRALERLLDLYLADNPEQRQKTVDEVRVMLAGTSQAMP